MIHVLVDGCVYYFEYDPSDERYELFVVLGRDSHALSTLRCFALAHHGFSSDVDDTGMLLIHEDSLAAGEAVMLWSPS